MLARRGQKALGEAIKADCDGGVFDVILSVRKYT